MTTLPHICHFYPHKMRCYGKKITPHVPCMPYHCQIWWIFRFLELFVRFQFNGFFVFVKFAWDFHENVRKNENFAKFRENRPIFAWLSHFRKNLNIHFRFNPRFCGQWSSNLEGLWLASASASWQVRKMKFWYWNYMYIINVKVLLGLKRKFSFSHFRENLFLFSRKFLNENYQK
jgi:hypothetical protein